MTNPIIGITTYSGENVLADEIVSTSMLPGLYIKAVRNAGGRPVLLPSGGKTQEAQDATTDYVDGLLLPGGPDINPALYGQTPERQTGPTDTQRDQWEFALIMQALNSEIPVLGVCRGMQMINVVLGGSLIQNIPENLAGLHGAGRPGYSKHPVDIDIDSMLGEIMPYEIDPVVVTTRHHQAVDHLGGGLKVVATAQDGCPEAIESDQHPFLLGVQWHPERDEDQSVFTALVEAARKAMG